MHPSRIAGALLLAGAVAAAAAGGATGTAQARLLMDTGLAHERGARYRDAIADFTQALALKTLSVADSGRALFDRGVAYDALGRTQDAIADYSGALRRDPRFAPALNNRANAYRRLGRLDKAKHDYLAALESGDNAREYPYYGLGRIAQDEGDSDAARDDYLKALGANPGYALAAQSVALLPGKVSPASYELRPARAPRPSAVILHPPRPAPVRVAQADPGLRQAILDPLSRTPAASSAQVQLGAFHDQAAATQGWNKIAAEAGGALQALSPSVVPADVPGKGRVWRLRTGVGGTPDARKLCAALAAKNLACMIVRD